jgi:small-conductance mechanosensitive channel
METGSTTTPTQHRAARRAHRRIVPSIIIIIGFLAIGLIIYAYYWSTFDLTEQVMVIVALIIALIALLTVSFYWTRRGPIATSPDATAERTTTS